ACTNKFHSKLTKANPFLPTVDYVLPDFSVQTPLQEKVGVSNMPSVIRPKLEELRKNNFRAARGDELAFSVDGSPIVVLPSTEVDPETRVFKQIMEEDGEGFSPNSREVFSTFKNLLRQKIAANAVSQELD
ncbi:unnamed protein product, partial [Strongylus vulgaris]